MLVRRGGKLEDGKPVQYKRNGQNWLINENEVALIFSFENQFIRMIGKTTKLEDYFETISPKIIALSADNAS